MPSRTPASCSPNESPFPGSHFFFTPRYRKAKLISATNHLFVGPGAPDNLQFGGLMMQLREMAGLSRSEVALRLGLTSEYIRLIERGFRIPAFGQMPRFFEMYGVSYMVEVENNVLLMNDLTIEFTSRIHNARNAASTQVNRNECIGQIVALMAVADDHTLLDVRNHLLQART